MKIGKLLLAGLAAVHINCTTETNTKCRIVPYSSDECVVLTIEELSNAGEYAHRNNYRECTTMFDIACCCGVGKYKPPQLDGKVPTLDVVSLPDKPQWPDFTPWPDTKLSKKNIQTEKDGIDVLVNELTNANFQVNVNTDMKLTLKNSKTGKYDLILTPDIVFRSSSSKPYSFLEFNSSTNPGIGFASNAPWYREVQPGPEYMIRNWLKTQIKKYGL